MYFIATASIDPIEALPSVPSSMFRSRHLYTSSSYSTLSAGTTTSVIERVVMELDFSLDDILIASTELEINTNDIVKLAIVGHRELQRLALESKVICG